MQKEEIYYYSKDIYWKKNIYWVQVTPSSEPVTGYTVMDQKETRFFPHVIHSLKEDTKLIDKQRNV